MNPLPSPCVRQCRIDPASGWCVGCLRTLDEITLWRDSSEAQRQIIWQRLAERRQTLVLTSGLSPATAGSLPL